MRCSYAPYILPEKAHLFDYRRPESPCLFKPASAMVKGFPCRVRQEVVNANVAAIETKCTCLFSGVVAPRVHYKCRQHAGNIPATMACSLCVKSCRQSQLVRMSQMLPRCQEECQRDVWSTSDSNSAVSQKEAMGCPVFIACDSC